MKIQKKNFLGGGCPGGGVGGGGRGRVGGQSGCERRIEVFVKIQKKKIWGGGGGGRGVGGGGRERGQGGFERRIEVFVKIQKPEDHRSCTRSPDISANYISLHMKAFIQSLVQLCTLVSVKIQFKFLYVHHLGPRSRNVLDLQYSHIFIYSIRCLFLLTFRSLDAIVSEKSTVVTFSYRKA